MAGIGTVHTSMTADGVIIAGFLPGIEKCPGIGELVIGITCGEVIRGDPLSLITVGSWIIGAVGIGARIMDGTVRVLPAAAPVGHLPDGNLLAAVPAGSLPDGNRLAVAPTGSLPDGNRLARVLAGSLQGGNRPAEAPVVWINPEEVPAERVSPVAAQVAGPVGRVDRVIVRAVIMAWDRSPVSPVQDKMLKILGLVILCGSGEQSWREDPGDQAEQQDNPVRRADE